MRVVITQSNYIPWKGYFDAIASADIFMIYDDMQYTKRDWRNRNLIKTPEGIKWLSIPVEVKGKFLQKINETKVSDLNWKKDHINLLKQYYKRAKHYTTIIQWLEDTYQECPSLLLTEINEFLLKKISIFLGIKTVFRRSEEFILKGDKTEKLVNLCIELGATEYWTGPAAKEYLKADKFTNAGIKVCYFDYSGYPEYEQLDGPFVHGVSILDLLFNEGVEAKKFLKKASSL